MLRNLLCLPLRTHTHFLSADCRENVLLQGVFHPGLFVNGKWSCCEHRSRHSQGCKTSFCGNHQDASPPGTNHVSPTKALAGGVAAARGPLPPTPMDEAAPTPPPHSSSSRYHGTHIPNPNSIQSYEHHDPDSSQQDRGKRKGGGGIDERGAQPFPPPIPVSVCMYNNQGFLQGEGGWIQRGAGYDPCL